TAITPAASAVTRPIATPITGRGTTPGALSGIGQLQHTSEMYHRAGQGSRDPFDVLNPSDNKLAEEIDVVRLSADDDVVRSRDILGGGHSRDTGYLAGDRGGLANLGLDQDVRMDHGAPLRLDESAQGRNVFRNVPQVGNDWGSPRDLVFL